MTVQKFYDGIWKKRLPQLCFYLGLTIELGMVIVDKSNYINPIEGWLFRITFLLFALKLVSTEYTWGEWCLIAFLEVIGYISYRVTGKNDIIRIVTFAAACKGIPLKQMLRYTFYVTLAGCVSIVFLSVTGIYGEISVTANYGRGYEQTRYTLGMGHPNALSCMYLMVTALGIYAFSERMRWYVYLFLMLLNVGVYGLTNSKTSMLITTLLLAVSCFVTYCHVLRDKKAAYLCGAVAFLLCVLFSVDASASALEVRQAKWNETYLGDAGADMHTTALLRIDEKINGRIVSLTDSTRNDGTIGTWAAFSYPENMGYYFDMGWVKLFYRFGIIPGILYCISYLALFWQCYWKKDIFGAVLLAVLAVYSVVEAHLFSIYIGRNFLLMMMGGYFFEWSQEQNPESAVNRG